jgi:hypothetical protein
MLVHSFTFFEGESGDLVDELHFFCATSAEEQPSQACFSFAMVLKITLSRSFTITVEALCQLLFADATFEHRFHSLLQHKGLYLICLE